MSTIIQIKRSTGSSAPTTSILAEGELAYSQDRANNGAGAVLYIESIGSDGVTQVIDKIGGKYYTNTVDEILTPATTSTAGAVELFEATTNGTSKIVIKAPTSLAGDTTYTLPASPVATYFLQTDASGNLSWTEVSGTTLNINGLTAVDPLADADEFIVYDASATSNKKITAENVADYIFAGVSGDITIAETGVATISANSVELGTDTTGSYVATITGTANQIAVTGSGTETAGVTVTLTDDVILVGDLTVGGNDIKMSGGTTAITFSGTADVAITGDLTVTGNDIKSSTATALTLSGGDVEVKGDLQVTGNDIKSSTGATALTLDGANVTVAGNLTVNGASTIVNSTTVTIDDVLLKLADNNTGNSVDTGVYAEYVETATTKYAGWFRDASDGNIFKFFLGLEAEPTTTVNTAGTGYTVGTIFANLTGGSISNLATDLGVADGGTGASTFTTNGVLYGNGSSAIQATAAGTDKYFLYSNNGTPAWTNTIDGGTY